MLLQFLSKVSKCW